MSGYRALRVARLLAPVAVLATAATVLLVRAFGDSGAEPQQSEPHGWTGCCLPLGGYDAYDTSPVDAFGGGVIALLFAPLPFLALYALRRLRRSRRVALARMESSTAAPPDR